MIKKLLTPANTPADLMEEAGRRLVAGDDPDDIAADLRAQGIDAYSVPVSHDEYRRRTGREPDWEE